MYHRLETDSKPVQFSKEWGEDFKSALLKIYGEQCIDDDKTFAVFGFLYPQEMVMIISYLGTEENTIPLTLFLSADVESNKENKARDKIINDLFDSAGVVFDHCFSTFKQNENNPDFEFDEYVYDWQEFSYKKFTFHYMLTRENVELSLMANELLKDF